MAYILYFGDSNSSSTSAHRANALKRLGHSVDHKDPFTAISGLNGFNWLTSIHFRTGYRFIQNSIAHWIFSVVQNLIKPDLIWVDGGEYFGLESLKLLKTLECPIVLYNIDDPTGKRDGHRFDSLLQGVLSYDLAVVVRKETEQELRELGMEHVIRVFRSYDEIAHQPYNDTQSISNFYKSEVTFIGTWMRNEKRDEFLLELLQRGVPLSIWGGRWQKSRYWKLLKSSYRGDNLGGRDYVSAIQGAKICLGLLSKGNRDLHTTRSLEVTYAGGLLCAERTLEHVEMYRESVDAVFWSSPEECSILCHQLLNDNARREAIRLSGMKRVRELKLGNEDVCKEILNVAFNEIKISSRL